MAGELALKEGEMLLPTLKLPIMIGWWDSALTLYCKPRVSRLVWTGTRWAIRKSATPLLELVKCFTKTCRVLTLLSKTAVFLKIKLYWEQSIEPKKLMLICIWWDYWATAEFTDTLIISTPFWNWSRAKNLIQKEFLSIFSLMDEILNRPKELNLFQNCWRILKAAKQSEKSPALSEDTTRWTETTIGKELKSLTME